MNRLCKALLIFNCILLGFTSTILVVNHFASAATVTFSNVKNNAWGNLDSSITAGATSITLESGDGSRFPSSNFYATLFGSSIDNHEIVYCSSRTTDTLTVTRGSQSTTAQAWPAGTNIQCLITAEHFTEIHNALTDGTDELDVGGVEVSTDNSIDIRGNNAGTFDIHQDAEADFDISSDGDLKFYIDDDSDSTNRFYWYSNSGSEIASLTDFGRLTIDSDLYSDGGSLTSFVGGTTDEFITIGTASGLELRYKVEESNKRTVYFSVTHDGAGSPSGTLACEFTIGENTSEVTVMTMEEDGDLAMTGDFKLATKTPSSASDTGETGTIAWDSSYIYICTATDTWKRVAISSW